MVYENGEETLFFVVVSRNIFVLPKFEPGLSMDIKQKTDYIKEPHTAMFTGQTGSGKAHLVLGLIGKEYNKHFDFIIII